ncbi:DUF397 domain-containing protein [Streptomyces buecherae]|uniref:DUF397 domain-containing protein n=1 Tax=Streptomyces buecherae TaxID=2763006 RepID=UPI001C25B282|nr:DUF397 domain-containing protein [Streptomyces buecherae]
MSNINWQKSSFSGDRDDCVELGQQGEKIVMRESDEPNVVVTTTRAKLAAFIVGVKNGDFDHLL